MQIRQFLEAIRIKVNSALAYLRKKELTLVENELKSILRVLEGVFEEELYRDDVILEKQFKRLLMRETK